MTGRKMGRCNPENKGKSDEEILNKQFAEAETNGSNSNYGQGNGWHHGRGKGTGRHLGAGRRNHGNQDTF
jgi:hypothetical protein